MIGRAIPWTRQPQIVLPATGAFSRGLVHGFNAAARNAINPTLGIVANSLTRGPRGGEIAISDTGVTASQAVWTGNSSPESAEFTVLVKAMRFGAQPDSGFGMAFALTKVAGTADPFHIFIKDAGERVRFNTTTIDNNESNETTTDWVVNRWMVGVYRWRSGENLSMWRDGVEQARSVTASVIRSGVLKPATNMAISLSTLRLNGAVSLALVWNRALSDSEIVAVSANPWQIFAPLQRRIWVPAAAAGGFQPAWAVNANSYHSQGAIHAA